MLRPGRRLTARAGRDRLPALVRTAAGAWFVASTSHGVALLLVPALLPTLCSAGAPTAAGAWSAAAAVALHGATMLAVAGVVSASPRPSTDAGLEPARRRTRRG